MLSALVHHARRRARASVRVASPPRVLTYIVTFSCNARCVMCDSWRRNDPDDLTLSEIEAVFRQLPALHGVRLSGGEPFVRADLGDIVALATEHLAPLGIHITTNGFQTERIVSLVEGRDRRVPLHLMVSLDGLESKHNEIRGRAHAFRRATATLRALAPRRQELNLRLAVNQTVVDASGIDEYGRLHEWLAPLEVNHQVVVAYDASATYSAGVGLASSQIGSFSTFGALPPDELERFLTRLYDDAAAYPQPERALKRYYIDGLRTRLLGDPAAAAPKPNCVALREHLRLFPNGDVPTCQFNGHVVGNLRTQTFEEVWASAARAEQRGWVERCAGCWAECEVVPNAVYSGDLLKHSWRRRPEPSGHRQTRCDPAAGGPGPHRRRLPVA